MAVVRTPRSSWIEEGLRALASGGHESVRVEQLARALGVTKGGFYWHFDDRIALLDEMLDAWEKVGVDDVVAAIEGPGGDARAKLWRLSKAAGGKDVKLDLAFREWARRDRKVARRMKRVDNRRMDYLRSLFGEIGHERNDVEVRAMLMYSLWIANPFIAADHGTKSRADVMKATMRWLLA
jgi:AcrR family transcriptional regulator